MSTLRTKEIKGLRIPRAYPTLWGGVNLPKKVSVSIQVNRW